MDRLAPVRDGQLPAASWERAVAVRFTEKIIPVLAFEVRGKLLLLLFLQGVLRYKFRRLLHDFDHPIGDGGGNIVRVQGSVVPFQIIGEEPS